MRPLQTLFSIALLGSSLAQAGSVVVSFENPERYTDLQPQRDAQALQQTLTQQLQALADKRLPASQTLTLVITDIDLAGEIRPGSRRLHDVRVMGRQADWPSISLRYSLQEGDKLLAQGSERISDMAYLMRSMQASSQPLPYEQRMLSDWFNARFGQPAAH